MKRVTPEYQFEAACDTAGLQINGSGSADPQIHDSQRFYKALWNHPFLALWETYCAEIMDVKDVWDMMYAFSKAEMKWGLQRLLTTWQKFRVAGHYLWGRMNFNRFHVGQSRIANDHYNLDNPLMALNLGPTMKYTSAFYYPQYWEFNLDIFQKLDLEIAGRRMWLKEGDELLDIGFWFGENTKYLVERFWVKITGLTISQEQKTFAEDVCRDIRDSVDFILMDWRQVTPEQLKKFDHVSFFEMIESIGGPKNFLWFFNFIRSVLKDDGNIFGQILSRNNPSASENNWVDTSNATDPWIDRYIFKWGVLPRIGNLITPSEQAGLFPRLIDNSLWRANGETCKAWNINFQNGWGELRDSIDEELWITKWEKYMGHFRKRFPYEININTFQRIWEFYLLCCEWGHRAWYINDWHFLWETNSERVSLPDIDIPKTREAVLEFLR